MYYFVFLIVRRSHQRMQPWSALLAYLTPIFLCCRTPFTPALACCCFCRLVALSGTMTIWDTGRKRQRWVRRTVEVMFTLAPRGGAQVGYSMGNNVKTPFFQVPAPEYHHVISYTTSKVCLLLRRFVFRTEGERETRVTREWLVTTRKAHFLLPAFLFSHEDALMALMCV